MKKLFFFFVAILLVGSSVSAQPGKGSVLIGGSSSLDLTFLNNKYKAKGDSEDAGKTTSIEFSPVIGYFLTDALVAGIELPISFSSEKDVDDDKYSTTIFAFGPFARYYFGTTNMKPFVHGQIGFGSLKEKQVSDGDTDTESHGLFGWQIGGGMALFIKQNLAIDFGLSYGSTNTKYDEGQFDYTYKESGIGLNVGLSLFFGGENK